MFMVGLSTMLQDRLISSTLTARTTIFEMALNQKKTIASKKKWHIINKIIP